MFKIFRIRKIHQWLIIEKLHYPHIILFISFTDQLPEIKKIKILENCPASDIAKAISQVNSYLLQLTRTWFIK